jgi:hypothetical protein
VVQEFHFQNLMDLSHLAVRLHLRGLLVLQDPLLPLHLSLLADRLDPLHQKLLMHLSLSFHQIRSFRRCHSFRHFHLHPLHQLVLASFVELAIFHLLWDRKVKGFAYQYRNHH